MPSRREVVAGSLALLAAPAGANSPWEEGAPLPFAVQEIYPTLWRGRLVVGGGFRARGPGFVANLGALWPTAAVVWAEPAGESWSALPDMPGQRHHPFLSPLGDALLAIGGFSSGVGGIWRMERQVWRLSAPQGRWREGPPLPRPQAEVVGGILDGALLIAGGRTPAGEANGGYGDHRDTGDAFVLAPGARGWQAIAPLPTPRNSAAAAVLGGRLHVVGGRILTPQGLRNLDVHEAYDPATRRWQTLAPMPEARGGHAAASLGGRLYAFGGESFGDRPTAHDEVFEYDPGADRWRRVATMPAPRHGLGAVAAGGAIHLLGGAAEAGGRATSDSHVIFRPA